jgi:hypothetical protein
LGLLDGILFLKLQLRLIEFSKSLLAIKVASGNVALIPKEISQKRLPLSF